MHDRRSRRRVRPVEVVEVVHVETTFNTALDVIGHWATYCVELAKT